MHGSRTPRPCTWGGALIVGARLYILCVAGRLIAASRWLAICGRPFAARSTKKPNNKEKLDTRAGLCTGLERVHAQPGDRLGVRNSTLVSLGIRRPARERSSRSVRYPALAKDWLPNAKREEGLLLLRLLGGFLRSSFRLFLRGHSKSP